MNNAEKKVSDRLKSYGFSVERISEQATRTPDFFVTKDGEGYLIEIKEKSETNKKGSHYLKSGYSSSIASVLRKAKGQLVEGREQKNPFRILWIVLGADDTQNIFLRDRIISTLYGVQRVELERNGFSFETDFYRLFPGRLNRESQIDCVIIEDGTGLIFCLNDEAESYSIFRDCQLFKLHKSPFGVIDPIAMSKDGRCIMPTIKGDRIRKKRNFLRENDFERISEITETRFVAYAKGTVREGD